MQPDEPFDRNASKIRRPKLPKRPLSQKFFQPFLYWGFWVKFLILSCLGTIAMPGLIGQLGFVAILMFYAVHIFESTASGDDCLNHYPEFDVFDAISRLVWFLFVLVAAVTPGMVLRIVLFRVFGLLPVSLENFSTVSVAVSFFCLTGSFFLLTPFFILSGMLNESPFNIFSNEVCESVSALKKVWFSFYLLSLLFFVVLYATLAASYGVVFSFAESRRSVLIYYFGLCAIGAFATTGAVFVYFRLLGKLAAVVANYLRKKQQTEARLK